jgi:PAS domain-containing protein
MGFISIPGYWNDYKSTCQLIGDILYLKGNYKNSIEFNRMAMAYTDSIWLKMNQMDLSIIESNQEAQRQKNRINLLTFENQERENTIKLNNQTIIKQKAFIITSSILLFIVLVFSILLGVLLNQKRKSNIFLEANNRQIALQKEEIEAQRAYLAEINSELEKLSLVARETDNAIRIIDAKGEVIWINESYTRLHGYTLDDLKQRNVLFFTSIPILSMFGKWLTYGLAIKAYKF